MKLSLLLVQIGALVAYVHVWFLFAVIRRRNDIADVAWGPGFVLLAAIGFVHRPDSRSAAILILVSLWGCRLAYHIFRRFLRHDDEDRRYQEMRKGWGDHPLLGSWLNVFLGQGFFLLLVAAPLIALPHGSDAALGWVNFLGVAVWLFGYMFEVIADKQLKDFLLDPKRPKETRIMRSGLWRYSRHPNYFGEATLWWGIWLVAFGPHAWLTVAGPITITVLLRFVSGVPLAEAGFKGDPEFEAYRKTTPAMLPNPFIGTSLP